MSFVNSERGVYPAVPAVGVKLLLIDLGDKRTKGKKTLNLGAV